MSEPRSIYARMMSKIRGLRAAKAYGRSVGADRSMSDIRREYEGHEGSPGRLQRPYLV